jgi:SAM-dependent methyltransferase
MTVSGPRLSKIHRNTLAVYEASAERWDELRSQEFFEQGWIDRFVGALPAGAAVLYAGCGTGRPIAAYLLDRGYRVTGIDASRAMIDRARASLPRGDWRVMDMRSLSLPRRFDGIIGWDSFFHLDPEEQRAALRGLPDYLRPGGALLLTIGDAAGEVLGAVDGEPVYHASLAPEEYDERLRRQGFGNVEYRLRDPDCGAHSILLATGYAGDR